MTNVYLFVYLFIFIPMYVYLSVRNALPMIPLSQVKISYIPKFYLSPIETFLQLLLYCTLVITIIIHSTSIYASELWFDRYRCRHHFNKAAVSYHYSLRKILGIPKYFSNHFNFDIFNAFNFEHFINFKCIKFLFWLVKCRSPCLAVHRYYFHNFILLNSFIDYVFRKYEIVNIFENDSDAIHSKLLYVQNRVPCSQYFPV